MNVNWEMISSIATATYGIAFLISLLFMVVQLRRQSGERFVESTQKTFEIWMADWRPGSRPKSVLPPTASTSTGSWAGRIKEL